MLTQLDEEGARSPVSQPLLTPHPPQCPPPSQRGLQPVSPPPDAASGEKRAPCLPWLLSTPSARVCGHGSSVLSSRSSQKPSQNPSVCTLPQTSHCVGPRPPAMGDPDPMLWGNKPPHHPAIKGTLPSLPTSAPPPGLTFLWATDSFPLHLNSLPSPQHLFSEATPLPMSPAYIHIRSKHLAHLLLGFLTLCLLSACGS